MKNILVKLLVGVFGIFVLVINLIVSQIYAVSTCDYNIFGCQSGQADSWIAYLVLTVVEIPLIFLGYKKLTEGKK